MQTLQKRNAEVQEIQAGCENVRSTLEQIQALEIQSDDITLKIQKLNQELFRLLIERLYNLQNTQPFFEHLKQEAEKLGIL